MAKVKYLLLFGIFVLGVMATTSPAEEQALGMGKPSVWSSLNRNYVWSPKGELLGRVWDFVIDSKGKVTFVVVSQPPLLGVRGKTVAVPFGSFAYDRQKERFVLDIPRERLISAPAFSNRSLYSEKWAEDMYRYFGRAPYWTEGELVEKGMKAPEEPGDFSGTFSPHYYRP
jgi:sporulation protein YlmC with PRC-barrel domain